MDTGRDSVPTSINRIGFMYSSPKRKRKRGQRDTRCRCKACWGVTTKNQLKVNGSNCIHCESPMPNRF